MPGTSDDDALGPTRLSETDDGVSGTGSTERIGPYRLLHTLGEGGMGEVWLAEQLEPVKRRVALKVIKQGMDTKQVVARFAAEKQALALMDHPAIAKVFDAGVTPHGRPYFVMEYVQGLPITEHCDRHTLTTRERLALFMQVCEGVQHAHQKAVIHRDIKPGNVLVSLQDDRPVPKIIDFGVAKATAQKLTEHTMHTQLGVMIGTPAYMSPEQAEMTGQDVDTRTDVYALGVVLYELLVGALPFDMREFGLVGFAAMVRKIREDEPPKPSTRLSTLGEHSTQNAKKRHTELPALRRELSGDLDWIVMKTLEKDRTRRYSSPSDLAADIERYLTDQPVLASPPSTTYRARKFVKRHTWGVAAAAVGVVTLIAFATIMTVQAGRIAVERDLARQAQADLEAVATFQAAMLSATDPQAMGRHLIENLAARVAAVRRGAGRSETQVAAALDSLDELVGEVNSTDLALDLVDEEILAASVRTLEREFGDRPLIDARLRETIGWSYRMLGRFERAAPQLEQAVEIRRRMLGDDDPLTLDSISSLAMLYEDQGRYAESEALGLESLESRRRVLGDNHPDSVASMNNLANLYRLQGRHAEAEPLYLSAVAIMTRTLGGDHPDRLLAVSNLAGLYVSQHRHAEAEPLYLETLETRRLVLGADHPDTLSSVNNLAALYARQSRYEAAEPLYLETLETQKRVLGAGHPETLSTMNNLAVLYSTQGRHEMAKQILATALIACEKPVDSALDACPVFIHTLGELHLATGDLDEAEVQLRRAIETYEERGGHQYLGLALNQLAGTSARLGHRGQALELLRRSLARGSLDRAGLDSPDLVSLHGDPEFEAIAIELQRQIPGN